MSRLSEETIARIDALPILEVVRQFGNLGDWDGRGKARCPLHREKTGSFTINTARNSYHCFGCGAGGGPVQFVMQSMGMEWLDAVRTLAEWGGIPLENAAPLSEKEREEANRRHEMMEAVRIAQGLMVESLRVATFEGVDRQAWGVREYCNSRFGNPEDADSPAATHLLGTPGYDFAPRLLASVRESVAIELGLLKRAKRTGSLFCPYSGRLVFTINSRGGRPIGFAGRVVERLLTRTNYHVPKYVNSPESPIFAKRAALFGFPQAATGVQRHGYLFLVEGYADALRLHAAGYDNALALMGTAFSQEQIALVKAIARRVTIIPDTDPPGQEAGYRNATMLQKAGVDVQILILPTGADGQKQDADSYFDTPEKVEQARAGCLRSLPVWRVERALQKSAGGADQGLLLDECRAVAAWMLTQPEEMRLMLIPRLGAVHGGEELWTALVRTQRVNTPGAGTPEEAATPITLEEKESLNNYGIANRSEPRALIVGGKGEPVSNFTLQPHYYIESTGQGGTPGKRIVELKNTRGEVRIVEFPAGGGALRSVSDARGFFSNLGNFSYFGSPAALVNLNRFINDQCSPCHEITGLGWNPVVNGWVWCDGVYWKGELRPFSPSGVVTVGGRNFYLPAANRQGNPAASNMAYQQMLSFKGRVGNIGVQEYFSLFHRVYGANGRIAILYMAATILRDVIFAHTGMFPLLNAFGPPMTGKSRLGRSMMAPFFTKPLPMNLPNSTMVSLAATLGWYSNAVVMLDEYRNDLRDDRQEFLKSIYDGGGRSKSIALVGGEARVNVTSQVLSGVYLSGQQIPEADVALFTRVLMLSFENTRFDEKARGALQELTRAEKEGRKGAPLPLYGRGIPRAVPNSARSERYFTSIRSAPEAHRPPPLCATA